MSGAAVGKDPHLLTIGQLADLLRVPVTMLARLARAGLVLSAARDADGTALYHDREYARLRLIADLVDAGATTSELAELDAVTGVQDDGEGNEKDAAATAAELGALVERILVRLQERLERLRHLRADLAATRDALMRCRHCHRTTEELGCRTCRALPKPMPRMIDRFFCPAGDEGGGAVRVAKDGEGDGDGAE